MERAKVIRVQHSGMVIHDPAALMATLVWRGEVIDSPMLQAIRTHPINDFEGMHIAWCQATRLDGLVDFAPDILNFDEVAHTATLDPDGALTSGRSDHANFVEHGFTAKLTVNHLNHAILMRSQGHFHISLEAWRITPVGAMDSLLLSSYRHDHGSHKHQRLVTVNELIQPFTDDLAGQDFLTLVAARKIIPSAAHSHNDVGHIHGVAQPVSLRLGSIDGRHETYFSDRYINQSGN